MSDEEDVTPNFEDMVREAIGLSTADLAERRFEELGKIALTAADLGVAFCYVSQFRRKDSSSRAVAFVLNGELPDDLLTMIEDYARGAAQDYLSGNKGINIISKGAAPTYEDPPTF
jgi:hypothetical protein